MKLLLNNNVYYTFHNKSVSIIDIIQKIIIQNMNNIYFQ